MRKLIASLALLLLPMAFATHFTGTFVDQQNGVSLTWQHQQDGTLQGQLTGPSGNFQLQGQGNEQGAWGTAQSTQGMLGFQAQLSQDNQTLQIAFFQADQNNQPQQVGTIVLQRSGAGMPGSGMGQPGGFPNQPTQPGGFPNQPTQPGGFPTTPGQPGMGQQPGGFPTTPGQPGMGQQPGGFPNQPTQPGGFPTTPGQQPGGFPTTPGQGGMGQQPGIGQQPGFSGQPGFGATQPGMGDWNGAWAGNGSQLVMVVQPSGQPGQYTGYFEGGGQRYQLMAEGDAQTLNGVYLVNGQQVPFYAQKYEGGVYLVDGSDGTEYLLEPANR